MKVDRNNIEFAKIEKVVTGKVKVPKIAADAFIKASAEKQQTLMLKGVYQDGLRAAGAVLSKNFRCFMDGHDDHNPSMHWSNKALGHHCFGCMEEGHTFDLFDAIKVVYDLKGRDPFRAAFRIAVNLFVKDGEKLNYKKFNSKNASKNDTYVPATKAIYKLTYCRHYTPVERDSLAVTYLNEHRGISLSTAKRLKIMTWDYLGNSYIIFPNDDGSFARRLFYAGNDDLTPSDRPNKWWNKKDMDMGLFNQRALPASRDAGKVIFITESALDAMTVEDAGFYSLALNGIGNMQKLCKLVFSDKNHHAYKIIGLLDNDEPGIRKVVYFTQNKFFVPDCLRSGYSGNRFLSRFKDINEAWLADRSETKAELRSIAVEAEAFYNNGGHK